MSDLLLLPNPRTTTWQWGTYRLEGQRRIVLEAERPAGLLFTAQRLQSAIQQHAGVEWEISASTAGDPAQIGARLRVKSDATPHPQGYQLSIGEDGIIIESSTAAGVFYGVCTLSQILEQSKGELQHVGITDWPDFAVRGVMLDVTRDKVPTLETTLAVVEMLAGWKINQIQLYTEHTFAYQAHREVWEHASPFTGQDILKLDAFCRERFIELVPNQNSFGHMHRWLKLPRYQHLAETLGEFETPWNTTMTGPFGLAPEEPGSLELLRSLYDELLPHFTSNQFNVGCDETIDLGAGRTKAAVAERGVGRVYLDFIKKIYADLSARGKVMQFWGDIIIQYPDLIDELPKDAIALEWGYEANHPFAEHCPKFAASGLQFYVCPGTASWCSLAGRTENALGNLQNAAQNGRANGALGYLITDWGDRGHWQQLPVSFLGYAVGAAYSWDLDANAEIDVASVVSRFAFGDPSGTVGRVAYDLGNIYTQLPYLHNSSVLFWLLQMTMADLRNPDDSLARSLVPRFTESLTDERLSAVEAAIEEAVAPLATATINRPDGEQIRREFAFTARLMRHACRRGRLVHGQPSAEALAEAHSELSGLIEEYRELWLTRNRPGGLVDSVGRLERALADYAV
jgi:hexosaminidase